MNKFDHMGKDAMNRMEDIMNSTRLNEFLHRKEEEDKKEKEEEEEEEEKQEEERREPVLALERSLWE